MDINDITREEFLWWFKEKKSTFDEDALVWFVLHKRHTDLLVKFQKNIDDLEEKTSTVRELCKSVIWNKKGALSFKLYKRRNVLLREIAIKSKETNELFNNLGILTDELENLCDKIEEEYKQIENKLTQDAQIENLTLINNILKKHKESLKSYTESCKGFTKCCKELTEDMKASA